MENKIEFNKNIWDFANGIYTKGCANTLVQQKPIARLVHEPSNISIFVYKPINIWHRFWLRVLFGLKYKNINIYEN